MATGRLLPGLFKSNSQKLALGIWPWTSGLKSRLPEHYKKRFVEKSMKEPIPVHYVPEPGKYKIDEYGERRLVQNIPIPLIHPPEADLGLWGGEGFILGYKKKRNIKTKPPTPKLWKPNLINRILYSEILDRWMDVTVTKRTLNLIDEAFGFDFYILKTHEVDLKSKLGMKLKREMLMALIKKSMYPDDKQRQEEIYEKYKEFIIPEEEVEWLGLTITQAENKQAALEEGQVEDLVRPLKELYTQQLVEQLQAGQLAESEDSERSVFRKINLFKEDK